MSMVAPLRGTECLREAQREGGQREGEKKRKEERGGMGRERKREEERLREKKDVSSMFGAY